MSDVQLEFSNALEEQFLKFHEANPHIYTLILRFSREAKAAGRPRFSMRAIFQRIRWYTAVETLDDSEPRFKLNDHHTAFYARLVMAQEPEFAGFFETRIQRCGVTP